ncbi:MAG: phytase [Rhodanobacteraceae bacterium]
MSGAPPMQRHSFAILALAAIMTAGCAESTAPRGSSEVAGPAASATAEPTIHEAFVTTAKPEDNLDSPAVWRTPDGRVRVYVTAKGTHVVKIFDGETGAAIGSIGRRGTALGEFLRPNGISIVGDTMFVVERDGKRVQAFALPDATPLGVFGGDVLKKPYGIWVRDEGAHRYRAYVTDDFARAGTTDDKGSKAVHVFDVSLDGGFAARHAMAFGDASGGGRLRVVESIFGDVALGHLLIADEFEGDGSRLKPFDFDGKYAGRDIGVGTYEHQAEGFALYACAEGAGYWIGSDQSPTDQRYVVFDRTSFDYLGAVRPVVANTTDGVWLDQRASSRFPAGAFYVSHNDDAIAAFDWRDIASALHLRADCTRAR